MKKLIMLLTAASCIGTTKTLTLTPEQYKQGAAIAAIAAGTYIVLRLVESWCFPEQDQLDQVIREIVKTIIIQHKIATHQEIEEIVSRVLQNKYPHLTRERMRRLIQQVVKEEIVPLEKHTLALENKVQQLLALSTQEVVIAEVIHPLVEEESCCSSL